LEFQQTRATVVHQSDDKTAVAGGSSGGATPVNAPGAFFEGFLLETTPQPT